MANASGWFQDRSVLDCDCEKHHGSLSATYDGFQNWAENLCSGLGSLECRFGLENSSKQHDRTLKPILRNFAVDILEGKDMLKWTARCEQGSICGKSLEQYRESFGTIVDFIVFGRRLIWGDHVTALAANVVLQQSCLYLYGGLRNRAKGSLRSDVDDVEIWSTVGSTE